MEPEFVPEYRKPDAPGIWMNFDNTVSIYCVVDEEQSFEDAAQEVFALIQESQRRYPAWTRILYVDIEGHRDDSGRFEEDFVEFQQEMFFSTIAPFVTAFELPLTGGLVNPSPQRDDLPDELIIQAPGQG